MSRIGKNPVVIPTNVKVEIDGSSITVEGPKGKNAKSFPSVVSLEVKDDTVVVSPVGDSRLAKAMYGTARSIIASLVKGVVDGFSKELEIHGVGFRATLKGSILDLSLGYSHIIEYQIPERVQVTVTGNTKLKVEGIDKQEVGAVAAEIRSFYPPEPYKGKGVRIVGEYVRRKEGKTVA
ncbi:MAG: 50S ribosomal protein L6 [Opitutaceae bacterium]|nr:50S ribosomal protein L6 [Opitutaceae bacterium]